ncbi:MAG: hypothetical protein ACOYXU_11685 [Nitrospirota bacterium]
MITNFAATPFYPSLSLTTVGSVNGRRIDPIFQFWDADIYDGTQGTLPYANTLGAGLAEYTNANFFSEDTIGSLLWYHQFPFPLLNLADYHTCEDAAPPGSLVTRRKYVSRGDCVLDGQQGRIDHFLALSLLRGVDWLNPAAITSADRIDDRVREDYARDLIPRAVGYSAALIDYFFRNDIEITPPDRFVYGITTADGSFTEIRLKARNITSTGEPLSGGTIQLVLTYRQALEDPYRANLDRPVPTSSEATTIVVPVANNVTSIPSDVPVELVFDLSGTPLPRLITDLYAQVVYKGAWGTESEAVAVGYKDFSEPTPFDVINTMDYVCLNGQYLVAGSTAATAAADVNGNGVIEDAEPGVDVNGNGVIEGAEPDPYPHRLVDVLLLFSPVETPEDVAADHFTVRVPEINPAQYARMMLITEPEFSWSSRAGGGNLDDRDHRVTAWAPFTLSIPAVKNQDGAMNVQFSDVRGLPVWSPVWYANREYPENVVCPSSVTWTASPTLTGPVAMEIRSTPGGTP